MDHAVRSRETICVTVELSICVQDSDYGAVSLYTGCAHIGDDDWTAATLSDDGENVWSMVAQMCPVKSLSWCWLDRQKMTVCNSSATVVSLV